MIRLIESARHATFRKIAKTSSYNVQQTWEKIVLDLHC